MSANLPPFDARQQFIDDVESLLVQKRNLGMLWERGKTPRLRDDLMSIVRRIDIAVMKAEERTQAAHLAFKTRKTVAESFRAPTDDDYPAALRQVWSSVKGKPFSHAAILLAAEIRCGQRLRKRGAVMDEAAHVADLTHAEWGPFTPELPRKPRDDRERDEEMGLPVEDYPAEHAVLRAIVRRLMVLTGGKFVAPRPGTKAPREFIALASAAQHYLGREVPHKVLVKAAIAERRARRTARSEK